MNEASKKPKKCWGRTRNLSRCKRPPGSKLFCPVHRKQPLIWLYIGIFSILAGGASIYSVVRPAIPKEQSTVNADLQGIEQNVAERGIILLELGYNLYSFGLGAEAIPEELDSDRVNREMRELYTRLGLPVPDSEVGPAMFKATRSSLVSERDRHFLDIGMHLAAVYGIGLVMIEHRGTNYEVEGRVGMSGMAQELKTALRALGLLKSVEQERSIEDYLMPTRDDTGEVYSKTLNALKASILGEIRQQYGT